MTKKFQFSTNSYYIVRVEGGDTICGTIAHDIMFAMQKHFNYKEPTMKEKLLFITNYINF